MDWKTVLGTFAAVFLAELGDKTQLATLGLAASQKSRLSVFAGATLALVASTLLAVLLGTGAASVVPIRHIRVGAGLLFVAIGALLLLDLI